MYFDLPLEQLKTYLPERVEPPDFDDFWRRTLEQAAAFDLKARFEAADFGLSAVDVFDVTFNGWNGEAIKGWFLLPRQRREPLPCVVEYVGYGGGRSLPYQWLLWSSAGYANLVMDTRGQGSTWSPGDTPDREPEGSSGHYPGYMTRGILNPETYYYRRVFTDGVRAVAAALAHPAVDPERIAVSGASQGGGMALAVAGLSSQVKVVMPDVPFLCHYRRATEITNSHPYEEISQYLKIHRNQVEKVFNTLAYFDGVNFAARCKAHALFSVGLMDEICPPSTVFAAFNHFLGPKEIRIWSYSHHEAYDHFQVAEKVKFLKGLWG